MQINTHVALASPPKREDFKVLAQQTGPCLSLISSGVPPEQRAQRTRALLREAEERLESLSLYSREERSEFLQPLRDRLTSELDTSVPGSSVCYRTLAGLWSFQVPYALPETIRLGNYCDVLPLIPALSISTEFYILALSQKHTRVLRCTLTSSEEVELPGSVPTNLFEFNQQDQPDHRLENRSDAGQKGKSTHPGMIVSFGTGSDADQKDEYLHNYFRAIDRELDSHLRPILPLVLAGVDYELALYRTISQYPELVENGAHGAPDGLKGGELHERALECLRAHDAARPDHALAQYEKAGAARMQNPLNDIVQSAFDGRILHLFIADGFRQPGRFDQETRTVSGSNSASGDDDLVNVAALQTLAHGGDVFVLPEERVPGQRSITAALRF